MSKNNLNKQDSDDAKRLKAIFQNSQDGIITINARGLVESINPAAAGLFSYSPEEVIGQNIKMLMPEPYQSAHDGYLHNYKKTKEKKIIGIGREVKGKRKDGSVFPFFLSVSEVDLGEQKVFTGFIHDITELKEKEIELEVSRNRLRAIFDTAIDGIILINKKGIIQSANAAVIRLFGFKEDEILGKNVSMLMPEPHHSGHDQYLENYHRSRKPQIIGIGREVEGRRKDGTTFPFNLGVSEVENGAEVIYTGIIHDLTRYKQKEKEINELNFSLEQKVIKRTNQLSETVNKLLSSNQQLEFEITERKKVETALRESEEEILSALSKEKELNELKSRFVSMASHEFRTPLSTILSSVSLIGKYKEIGQPEKMDKHVNRIKSAVNNLTNILNDFLSLSKLEEGRIENQPNRFELNRFCDDLIEDVAGMMKPGQTINYDSLEGEMTVFLDERLLKNVVLNLLSNAIKYSPDGATIQFENKIDHDTLNIKIKDTGIGIPKADQEHLFSRFFRAANVSTIQGTGLGLNIVRHYVNLMNGSITFTSEENTGSTFIVQLPIK